MTVFTSYCGILLLVFETALFRASYFFSVVLCFSVQWQSYFCCWFLREGTLGPYLHFLSEKLLSYSTVVDQNFMTSLCCLYDFQHCGYKILSFQKIRVWKNTKLLMMGYLQR